MPSFGTYSAWIEVEGERLPEYGVDQEIQPDGSMQVSCWVPSSAGKEFVIGYSETAGDTATHVKFYIDGTPIAGRVISKRRIPDDGKRLSDGKKDGITTTTGIRPLQFGNCQLVEEDTGSATGIGEIQVAFFDTVVLKTSAEMPQPDQIGTKLDRPRELNEREKKGLVHSVQLGQKPLRPLSIRNVVTTRDGQQRVQFLFQYRPLDVLRAQGLVPRPGPPPKEPIPDAAVIDLTLESDSEEDKDEDEIELERLQVEMAATQQRLAEKKRKRAGTVSGRNVKREVKYESL